MDLNFKFLGVAIVETLTKLFLLCKWVKLLFKTKTLLLSAEFPVIWIRIGETPPFLVSGILVSSAALGLLCLRHSMLALPLNFWSF